MGADLLPAATSTACRPLIARFSLALLAAGSTLLLAPPAARAQTPFNYQGKLENNGTPYTGNASITFGLFSTATGGTALAQAHSDVPATNGIFTLTTTAFNASHFPGSAARWLEISIDSGSGPVPMTPRQQVTWSPLAMYAANAGTAATVTGPLTANLSMPNAGTSLSFGSTVRQMLNLWGTDYGIGVQSASLYQRSNNDFSWFKGGSHNDNQNNPGTGGTETMRLTGADSLIVAGSEAGFYFRNRTTPANTWALYADNTGTADTFRLWSSTTGDRVTVNQSGT